MCGVQPGGLYREFTLLVHVVAHYCAPQTSYQEASNIPRPRVGPQARFAKKCWPLMQLSYCLLLFLSLSLYIYNDHIKQLVFQMRF